MNTPIIKRATYTQTIWEHAETGEEYIVYGEDLNTPPPGLGTFKRIYSQTVNEVVVKTLLDYNVGKGI